MTANTPNYAIPYPEITDFVKDGATAMEAIAEKVDDVLFANVANRNLLYNGAMRVAQRATSVASITSPNYYTADRWEAAVTNQGTWTQSIENDAPIGSGFRQSLKMLCTTADASPAANDGLTFRQKLEGQDLQAIRKGTSDAKSLTMSFWVKSNKTGTYIAELYDNDNNRQISKSYTINASATWEYKTITFPADTTGAFDNDNNTSLFCVFWLGAGSTFTSGTLNSTAWASATSADRAVGQVNLADTTSNYWQVTGVQLVVGSTDTPFQFKSYAQELWECQRYFQIYPYGQIAEVVAPLGYQPANYYYGSQNVRVPMRATPSTTTPSPPTFRRASDATTQSGTIIYFLSQQDGTRFAIACSNSGYNAVSLFLTSTASAEL